MKFTYTKRKDGRLMKRVSINGTIKTLYSNNSKDLENQYIEAKHLSNKCLTRESNILVSDWSDKWVYLYKNDKEDATIEMYKSIIKLYIKPQIGSIPLKNLKQSDIMQMLKYLDDKNITRRKDVTLLTIKQILNSAIDNDLVYKNVASSIKLEKHKSEEKKPLSSTYISIIEKLSKNDSNAFLTYFLIYTGLRREELIPLKYSDIDFKNKTIYISKAVHFENNQPKLKTTKNKESREVPLLDKIYDTLNNMSLSYSKNNYIFANKFNNMMSETTFKRKIALAEKSLNNEINKINIKKDNENEKIENIHFTAHQLRHTYACILHKAKVPLKEAQYFIGHKDVKMLLNIYTHLDYDDKSNATKLLNSFVNI